jgi:primary-amine oxidase
MPVDTVGFKLRPEGFFDRSPVLDVPANSSGSAACHGAAGTDGSAHAESAASQSPAGQSAASQPPACHCHG